MVEMLFLIDVFTLVEVRVDMGLLTLYPASAIFTHCYSLSAVKYLLLWAPTPLVGSKKFATALSIVYVPYTLHFLFLQLKSWQAAYK